MIRLALLAPALMLAIACAGKPAPNPVPQPPPVIAFDIVVNEKGTENPIEGAAVSSRGNALGNTNGDGYLLVPEATPGVAFPYQVAREGYVTGDFSHPRHPALSDQVEEQV
jgi:hypothetical protein